MRRSLYCFITFPYLPAANCTYNNRLATTAASARSHNTTTQPAAIEIVLRAAIHAQPGQVSELALNLGQVAVIV